MTKVDDDDKLVCRHSMNYWKAAKQQNQTTFFKAGHLIAARKVVVGIIIVIEILFLCSILDFEYQFFVDRSSK